MSFTIYAQVEKSSHVNVHTSRKTGSKQAQNDRHYIHFCFSKKLWGKKKRGEFPTVHQFECGKTYIPSEHF